MNYKKRLTFLFVGLFFIVLTSILSFIYISYSEFRREEFFERLREKSFTTAKLLAEVQGVDVELLKIIDQNSINKLYDEKILIFDCQNKLIYSSLDDEPIKYSTGLLDQIRNREDKYYVDEDDDEVVGVHYKEQGQDYVVLASAYDTYGIIKLKNLKDLVLLALLLGTLLIAFSSYFYIRQVFRPIDDLNQSIQTINENNLQEFIAVKKNKDELHRLAINYNQMLARLYKAFESQRAFVRNAAHELKTPLALINSKLERLQDLAPSNTDVQIIVAGLFEDVDAQATLIESLLLIQRLQSQLPVNTLTVRVDEALYESVRELNASYPTQKVEIDIDSGIRTEEQVTVVANALLLKICFRNLLENAALYGTINVINIKMEDTQQGLKLRFINAGNAALEHGSIFSAFYRQPQQQEKPGHGLGLSIVKQIIEMFKGTVEYEFQNDHHIFCVALPHT